MYTLGDRVKVQVARADLDRKQLDFALVSDEGNPNKPLKTQSANPRASKDKKHQKKPRKGSSHRGDRKNRD